MNHEQLFRTVGNYAELSDVARKNWQKLLREQFCRKGEYFVELGQVPTEVGFVAAGLLSQNYVSESGDTTIKYFFPEGRFAASAGAMLARRPSAFAIVALEDTRLLAYDFFEFRKLVQQHSDIAAFYIRYMERHWVIEKEPLEVSFRHKTARERYQEFLRIYPNLATRLRKHQIAAYLGITPTQLSRLLVSPK